jgi:zinc-ribbon domain
MLYCAKCGSSLPEESTLCLKCGFPVSLGETHDAATGAGSREHEHSATPARYGHHLKLWFPLLLAALASAAVFVAIRMKSDPSGIEIVKRHFVFYDEYSHGVWERKACQAAEHQQCVDLSYTVQVQACGPVTFSWRVFPSEDDLNYQGAQPRVDETKYAFYAFLIKDSGTLLAPQALGKPVPQACQYR